MSDVGLLVFAGAVCATLAIVILSFPSLKRLIRQLKPRRHWAWFLLLASVLFWLATMTRYEIACNTSRAFCLYADRWTGHVTLRYRTDDD